MIGLLLVLPARALEPGEITDISELSLEELLDRPVTSGTRRILTARQTPAVVTVITGEEIRRMGYGSLAEILRTVPGFYDLYDHSTHNMGVRGINGGTRAAGNVLQVRIDGQAVPWRTNTGNFFGEELVPLDAIERIEILRGPASALYGADAYLGVVHIVTREGASVDGVEIGARAGMIRQNPGGGGGLLLGGSGYGIDAMLALQAHSLDLSGQALPASSPVLAEPGHEALASELAQQDQVKTATAVGHISVGSPDRAGRLVAWGSLQRLDTGGELLDFAPMTHGSRVTARNQHGRLTWTLSPSERFELEAWVAAFDSRPTPSARFDLDLPDQMLLPRVSATGTEAGTTLRGSPLAPLTLTLGAEHTRSHHVVQAYDTLLLEPALTAEGQILREAGTIIPGTGSGETRDLSNVGVFGQAEAALSPALAATGGVRIDLHGVYGLQVSPRAALVLAGPDSPLTWKLLYGSSFKAPTAEQLYGNPIWVSDIRGTAELAPQRAQTAELAAGASLGRYGVVLADLFLTHTSGRVEYLQDGLWQEAHNGLMEITAGGELEAHLQLANPLSLRVGAGLAQTVTQRDAAIDTGESFRSTFPAWQVHTAPSLSAGPLHVTPELSLIAARPASQSNEVLSGEPYSAPPAATLALSAGLMDLPLLGSQRTSLLLRATDLLDSRPTDPGFGGVDYPGMGRTIWLVLHQELGYTSAARP
jgi:outer membrane receptor for ferrienterochelin and colicins